MKMNKILTTIFTVAITIMVNTQGEEDLLDQDNKVLPNERVNQINQLLKPHNGKAYFKKSAYIQKLVKEKQNIMRELHLKAIKDKKEYSKAVKEDRIKEIDSVLKNHTGKSYFDLSLDIQELVQERKDIVQKMQEERINEINEILKKQKANISRSSYLQALIKERDELKLIFLKNTTASVIDYLENIFPGEIYQYCLTPSPSIEPSNFQGCTNDNNKEKIPLEMGINLSAPQAESPAVANSVPFANIFKSARPFETLSPDRVKGQNGWPCFDQKGQTARTNLLESAQPGSIPNGIYPVHIKGDVSVNIRGAEFVKCPQEKVLPNGIQRKCLKINIPKKLDGAGLQVSIKGESAGACLEDFKIILPNGSPNYEDELLDGKIVFNQDYIDYLKPFKTMRMMNFMYSSPRMPDSCKNLQQKAITANKEKYNWNRLSEETKECLVGEGTSRNLANRAKLSDAMWGVSPGTDKEKWRGAPIEVAVELARQTGSDPWITIPHNASKAYMEKMAKEFATLKKDHPNMKFHIEYSNEVWNGRFWGSKAMNALKEDPFPNENIEKLREGLNQLRSDWMQKRAEFKRKGIRGKELNDMTNGFKEKMKPYREKIEGKRQAEIDIYVEKSLQAFKFFEDAIGAESLVRTLGTNQKDPGRTKRMIQSLKRIDNEQGNTDGKNLKRVDAIATATYFHGCWGGSPKEGKACRDYIKNGGKGLSTAQNADDVLSALSDPKNPEGVIQVIEQVKEQKSALDGTDIELVAYEGGQHLTLGNMPGDLMEKVSKDPKRKKELIKMFHDSSKHPKMGELYSILYNGWAKAGGKTHVNFIMAQSQSQYGSFGMSSNLNNKDKSYKYNAAKTYAKLYCDGSLGQ